MSEQKCPWCGGIIRDTRRRVSAVAGPMEGEWIVGECDGCNAGSVVPTPGYSGGIENFLALLAAKGCDPRVVRECAE